MSTDSGRKDMVIVYVSRTGQSKMLAQSLSELTGATNHEIIDHTSRQGFLRYMQGGMQARQRAATPIGDPGISLEGIKTVVIVQPIWASCMCPPVRTWLRKYRTELSGVKLALLVSQLGSSPGNFLPDVENEFGPIAAFSSIQQSLSQEEKNLRLKKFAENLL